MATLLVQYGAYHCGECLHHVTFEWLHRGPWETTQVGKDATCIAVCTNPKCERKGLRLKVKLQTIEVEELHDA